MNLLLVTGSHWASFGCLVASGTESGTVFGVPSPLWVALGLSETVYAQFWTVLVGLVWDLSDVTNAL